MLIINLIVNKTKNKENENILNTKKKIHYEYGKYSLRKNDYNGGISQLEQAKDYEDANTLVINAYIEQAEKYIKDNNLKESKQIYDYLPEDASHNSIDVATRKEHLDRFAELMICRQALILMNIQNYDILTEFLV